MFSLGSVSCDIVSTVFSVRFCGVAGSSASQMCRPHFHSPLHSWIAAESGKSMVPHAHSGWMQAAASHFSNRSLSHPSPTAPLAEHPTATSLASSGWMAAASFSSKSPSHPSPSAPLSVHPSTSQATSSSFSFPPTPPKDGTPENVSGAAGGSKSINSGSGMTGGGGSGATAAGTTIGGGDYNNPNNSSGELKPVTKSEMINTSSSGVALPGSGGGCGGGVESGTEASINYTFNLTQVRVNQLNAGEVPFSHTAHPVPTYPPHYMGGDYGGAAASLGFHPQASSVFKSGGSMSSSRPRSKARSSTGQCSGRRPFSVIVNVSGFRNDTLVAMLKGWI